MSKRKRTDEEDESEPEIQDQALRIKVSRLKAKLDQGLKSLISALKLARGLERQKLGRRQKQAQNEPHTLLRLREEVIVLRQFQLGKVASTHLLKQLSRTKRIKESPVFTQIYGADPTIETVKAGAEANVLGRLFSSAPVKQALTEVMNNVFGVLGIPKAPGGGSGRPAKAKPERNMVNIPELEDEFNGFSSDASIDGAGTTHQRIPQDHDEEEGSEGSTTYRVAPSEEMDDNEDSSDEHEYHQEDLSITSEDDGNPDVDSSRGLESTKSSSVKPTTKTAFLPSLSMGGYYSGSESDDFDQGDDADPSKPDIRKNRRGQRARQQLAEKKFGKNARHLQKIQAGGGGSRNEGWDARRGAVGSRGPNTYNQHSRSRPDGGPIAEQPPRYNQPTREKPKKRDDQGSLHPSWEAAKKRKMQDQGTVKFAGQKITFD